LFEQENDKPLVFGLQMFRLQPQIEAMGEGSAGQTELSRSKLAEMKLIVPSTPILDALKTSSPLKNCN
jgi:type I restriction enzyme S subunit